MKKILVPFDFSETATNALRFAIDIANQSDGEILLLHIVELPVMYDTLLMPSLSFEEAYIKDMKENAEKDENAMQQALEDVAQPTSYCSVMLVGIR